MAAKLSIQGALTTWKEWVDQAQKTSHSEDKKPLAAFQEALQALLTPAAANVSLGERVVRDCWHIYSYLGEVYSRSQALADTQRKVVELMEKRALDGMREIGLSKLSRTLNRGQAKGVTVDLSPIKTMEAIISLTNRVFMIRKTALAYINEASSHIEQSKRISLAKPIVEEIGERLAKEGESLLAGATPVSLFRSDHVKAILVQLVEIGEYSMREAGGIFNNCARADFSNVKEFYRDQAATRLRATTHLVASTRDTQRAAEETMRLAVDGDLWFSGKREDYGKQEDIFNIILEIVSARIGEIRQEAEKVGLPLSIKVVFKSNLSEHETKRVRAALEL